MRDVTSKILDVYGTLSECAEELRQVAQIYQDELSDNCTDLLNQHVGYFLSLSNQVKDLAMRIPIAYPDPKNYEKD